MGGLVAQTAEADLRRGSLSDRSTSQAKNNKAPIQVAMKTMWTKRMDE